MPTYYEILQIAPTASADEIEQAYEKQFNHWRRLVTHHDLEMVNRANQALQILQNVRAVLVDPQKRSAYNASLNNAGGLADPSVGPIRMGTGILTAPTPPRPNPTLQPTHVVVAAPVIKPEERVDAWICPKCKQANPLESIYCKGCVQTVGVNCPL